MTALCTESQDPETQKCKFKAGLKQEGWEFRVLTGLVTGLKEATRGFSSQVFLTGLA